MYLVLLNFAQKWSILCLWVVIIVWSLRHVWFETPWTLYSWDFPGKNTGGGCHFLLQGVFLTQGSNPHHLHFQVDSLPLSLQEIPCLCTLPQMLKEDDQVKALWGCVNSEACTAVLPRPIRAAGAPSHHPLSRGGLGKGVRGRKSVYRAKRTFWALFRHVDTAD